MAYGNLALIILSLQYVAATKFCTDHTCLSAFDSYFVLTCGLFEKQEENRMNEDQKKKSNKDSISSGTFVKRIGLIKMYLLGT